MTPAYPRLAMAGLFLILTGIVIAWLIVAPIPRLFGAATSILLGFSLLRRAFRAE